MSKSVFFSIIIPCFNRAELIQTTLKSIFDQPFKNLEVIVVNDGSTDETTQVIASIQDTRVRYFEIPNSERGAARNYGLTVAEGVYINYFDSDDMMNPCLKQVSDFILKADCPPVVYGAIENITIQGKSIGHASRPYSDFKRSIIHNNFLACGSVFLRRDIANSFSFSEDRKLSGTEDWELWLRIYAQHDFRECPYVIFQQQDHPSRSLNQMNEEAVLQREEAFVESIQNSQRKLQKRFTQAELNLLIADRFTLIALAQIENRNKGKALSFIRKSILKSLLVVSRKRFWALVKKLLFL